MDESIDLLEIEKEARAAFNEDGLLYLFIGLLLLAVGGSFLYRPLALFVVGGFLLIYPLEALRRRITYPRVGYAKFSLPAGAVRGIFFFGLLATAVLAGIAIAGDGRYQRILPLAYNALFALAFYLGLATQGIHKADWALILLALLLGGAASWLFLDWHEGTAVSFAATGLLFASFGLLRLAQFLRAHPLPPAQGNGHEG